jgi:F0F1-type ATP synthase assembly protein I
VERDEQQERPAAPPATAPAAPLRDWGLVKVFGAIIVAVVYGSILALILAAVPAEQGPWVALIGALIFLIAGVAFIYREVQLRQERLRRR